jgi:hypothetical protein
MTAAGGRRTGRGTRQQQSGRSHDRRSDDCRGCRDGAQGAPGARFVGRERWFIVHSGQETAARRRRAERHGRHGGSSAPVADKRAEGWPPSG